MKHITMILETQEEATELLSWYGTLGYPASSGPVDLEDGRFWMVYTLSQDMGSELDDKTDANLFNVTDPCKGCIYNLDGKGACGHHDGPQFNRECTVCSSWKPVRKGKDVLDLETRRGNKINQE